MLEGEGRFVNRLYGGGWLNGSHVTGDDEGRVSVGEEGTERDDVGGGRAVPEPPLRGRLATRSHVTGDDEGRPYVGRGDGEG